MERRAAALSGIIAEVERLVTAASPPASLAPPAKPAVNGRVEGKTDAVLPAPVAEAVKP